MFNAIVTVFRAGRCQLVCQYIFLPLAKNIINLPVPTWRSQDVTTDPVFCLNKKRAKLQKNLAKHQDRFVFAIQEYTFFGKIKTKSNFVQFQFNLIGQQTSQLVLFFSFLKKS